MAIPTIFTKQLGDAIASYDYVDIADGTGIQTLYGMTASTGAATYEYGLTTNSALVSAQKGYISLSMGAETTFDLDIAFNLPKIVKSNAYVSVPFEINATASGATREVYTKCTFYKYDGSTSSAISSEITSETFTATAGAISYCYLTTKIPLTQTNFKRGETLRLKMKANVGTGAGTAYCYLGISPSNQSFPDTGGSTKFVALVPFRINI